MNTEERAAEFARVTVAKLLEAWTFGPAGDQSERILAECFAVAESTEMKRLRVWVEALRMDRQMYADLYEGRTEQSRLEGYAAGKRCAEVDLARARETVAKMAEIIRTQAALLGHVVDVPIEASDMRGATRKA